MCRDMVTQVPVEVGRLAREGGGEKLFQVVVHPKINKY